MEIKIKETENLIEIEKIYNQELTIAKIIGVSAVIFLICIFYLKMPYWYIITPLFFPFLFAIYRVVELKFLCEYLYIDNRKLVYMAGYTRKKEKMRKREYKIDDLITFFPRRYERDLFSYPDMDIGFRIDKTSPKFRIHFHFKGKNDYEAFGLFLNIEKAEEIAKRIKLFLEKNGRKITMNPEFIPFIIKKEIGENLYTNF
ncbi:MAG: hypothetical protein KGV57_01815 [Fusobacterium sp.]|nr:hypothetical protein [Fusobacterium sp.]